MIKGKDTFKATWSSNGLLEEDRIQKLNIINISLGRVFQSTSFYEYYLYYYRLL